MDGNDANLMGNIKNFRKLKNISLSFRNPSVDGYPESIMSLLDFNLDSV